MTTTLAEPATAAAHSSNNENFADRLRQTMLAIRLSFTWFGVRRTLPVAQRTKAAESFGASHSFLSAGKKLLDTREPAFRAVTAIRNSAVKFLKHSNDRTTAGLL